MMRWYDETGTISQEAWDALPTGRGIYPFSNGNGGPVGYFFPYATRAAWAWVQEAKPTLSPWKNPAVAYGFACGPQLP